MKRSFSISLLVAVIVGASATGAQAAPVSTLVVGGTAFGIDLIPDPTKPNRFFIDEIFSTDIFEVALTGTLDPDPSVLFGLTVSNFGAVPLNVSLMLGVSFAPLAASTATSGITGTLNPGALAPLGLTLTPMLATLLTSSDGVANLGVNVGPGVSVNGTSAYGPFTAGPVALPPGLAFLGVNLAFSLTGGGDTVDLTGRTQVTAVPEPATLSLVGLGLLVAVRRFHARPR
jgi:hypothetical protein